MLRKCKYRFRLRAQSGPGTPLQCEPLPQGEVTLLIKPTAADECLKKTTHMYISLEMCMRRHKTLDVQAVMQTERAVTKDYFHY